MTLNPWATGKGELFNRVLRGLKSPKATWIKKMVILGSIPGQKMIKKRPWISWLRT